MIEKIIDKYTDEVKKYIDLGLSEEDALTLVEKHILKDSNISGVFDAMFNHLKTKEFDELFNKYFTEDVFDRILVEDLDEECESSCDKNKSTEKVSPVRTTEKKESTEKVKFAEGFRLMRNKPIVKEEVKESCKEEVNVIANTENHKEVEITMPNGYYKFKMHKI